MDPASTQLDRLNQGLNLLQSVQLPFALIPVLTFTGSTRIMGRMANGRLQVGPGLDARTHPAPPPFARLPADGTPTSCHARTSACAHTCKVCNYKPTQTPTFTLHEHIHTQHTHATRTGRQHAAGACPCS